MIRPKGKSPQPAPKEQNHENPVGSQGGKSPASALPKEVLRNPFSSLKEEVYESDSDPEGLFDNVGSSFYDSSDEEEEETTQAKGPSPINNSTDFPTSLTSKNKKERNPSKKVFPKGVLSGFRTFDPYSDPLVGIADPRPVSQRHYKFFKKYNFVRKDGTTYKVGNTVHALNFINDSFSVIQQTRNILDLVNSLEIEVPVELRPTLLRIWHVLRPDGLTLGYSSSHNVERLRRRIRMVIRKMSHRH